ncbi:MAG: cation:proton antiporter [Hyphomicrobiales bacterium]
MEHSGTSIELIVLGVLVCTIAYSLLSKLVSNTILTLPIIFVAIGYLCAPVTQAIGTTVELRESARLLAELTLVLILFADASHVRFSGLKITFAIPLRMLIIGLPGSIALGTLVVFSVFPAGGIALALLTAALLAPTDAAIGQAVVSSAKVPERLRQSINVEGGLNDGLVLPFVLLGAILASSNMAETDGLALFAVTQVVLGPIVGLAIGWTAARSLVYVQQRDWIVGSAQGIVFLSTAFVSYIAAVLVGGNGFIAAFVAGAVFGNTYRNDIRFIKEFMEGAGQLLTMAAFLVFGALMLPDGLAHISWPTVLVAILFLTVVRVLPILVSLAGTGLAMREKLFLGWFGPRGLASILFTLIIMDEFEFPNEEELLACVSLTVALSVLLHGISASPLAKRIGISAET